MTGFAKTKNFFAGISFRRFCHIRDNQYYYIYLKHFLPVSNDSVENSIEFKKKKIIIKTSAQIVQKDSDSRIKEIYQSWKCWICLTYVTEQTHEIHMNVVGLFCDAG